MIIQIEIQIIQQTLYKENDFFRPWTENLTFLLGTDVNSEACQYFFREGLTISFTKILTDDAVTSWKPSIHNCIKSNCEKLIELCVLKLHEDWFPLLELLTMVFDPNNK